MDSLSSFKRLMLTRSDNPATELISGDGKFNEVGLRDFINSVKFDKCDVSYAIVAIMGPQSSGKSTLLNHIFHTKFKEMDALNGRSQTTRGVWIAKALNMEPFTLVVDLEGTDGLERGEDDTAFEKQSALFALAVSDILLINIWCHDIGREHAANRPLLKTIFEVMIRLFSPRETTFLSPIKKKTTLLFVIRDQTKSPLEILNRLLRNDIEKPEAFEGTPLSEFFNVETIGLPSYELQENEFKQKVAQLRQQFSRSTSPGGIAGGSREGAVPASGFLFSAKTIWETIKQNKDLNLPAVKTMVARVRCQDIAKDKLRLFASNQAWLDIKKAAETKVVLGFGADISSILRDLLLEYDSEAKHYEENVRNEKRQYLESGALRVVHPVYMMILGHLRSEALKIFENGLERHLSAGGGFGESVRICRDSSVLDFDRRCSDAAIEQAKWGASKMREELVGDINTQRLLVRTEKLPQVVDQCRERVSAKIDKRLKELFVMGDENEVTWAEVRRILATESDVAAAALSSALVAFELDHATLAQMVGDIRHYARNLVDRKFRDEAKGILKLLYTRFIIAWEEKDSANTAATEIGKGKLWQLYRKCLKLLSTMAVLRLDETDDNVENVLFSALMGPHHGALGDPLASTTWEKVPTKVTLITPVQCKDIWKQFVGNMEADILQAKEVQEKSKKHGHWAPPFWVILGLVVFKGVAHFFNLLRVHSINFVALIGELVNQGIMHLEEGINNIKQNIQAGFDKVGEYAIAFRDKYGEVMKKLKKALKKFYDFMENLLSKKIVLVDA